MDEKNNIFLLTAERVMEYKYFPKIDFFVIDEFYKLSTKRDDERSDVLNNAFHLLANKHHSKFYLLGPNIDGISDGFTEKYDATFYRTDYSLVGNQVIDVYKKNKQKFDKSRVYKNFKENVLFELLLKLQNEQTIIYCSSPSRVRYLSVQFLKFLKKKTELNLNQLSIIEWIQENVSNKWSVIDCLRAGIGIHDGALQKHITSSIINYFNEGKLKYLFCTTTIIEGVNTSAKNVIFFDNTKGQRSPIDFFDYSNIKGRSGRMMIHYIGNIYNFNKVPEEKKVIVDIPFFEQNPVSDEILIQLDDAEIKNKKSDQYSKLNEIPEEEKMIIKGNGIFVDGQINILEKIRKDILTKGTLICWDGFPKYRQLRYVLGLGWDYLIRKGETTRPMTKDKIVKVTFDYAMNKSISKLVESNISYFRTLKMYENSTDQEIIDDSIRDAFQILRHWFQYKVPKWLSVINSLQKIVCEENGIEPGNYIYYAGQIENDFIENNLSILSEYGIPRSAIDKIKDLIPSNLNEDQVLEKLKIADFGNLRLLDYEKDKLKENL